MNACKNLKKEEKKNLKFNFSGIHCLLTSVLRGISSCCKAACLF